MKGEDLTVLEQTTQPNSQAFILVATLTISLKKPRGLNLLNGSRLYYKAITCEKKILSLTR